MRLGLGETKIVRSKRSVRINRLHNLRFRFLRVIYPLPILALPPVARCVGSENPGQAEETGWRIQGCSIPAAHDDDNFYQTASRA